jgi:hypothetical protein
MMNQDILVTVMLPTRQRVGLLERTVRSLLDNASDPKIIEIAIAYDDNDTVTHDFLNSSAWQELVDQYQAPVQIFQTEAWGYAQLHNYYNLLAKNARGQWLFLWNDDAVMKSPNWETHIREQQDFMGLLHMATENFRNELTLFPLVPQRWLDVFGTLSLCNLCDSWIQDICHPINAVRSIPPIVFHDRFDVTGNNFDSTYENRNYQKKIYKSDAMRAVRQEWSNRLQEYIKRNGACDANTPLVLTL